MLLLVVIIQLLLVGSTTCTIHYVGLGVDYDDDGNYHSAMTNNSIYILQHVVDHADEYFTSNTQLYLSPGEHHLSSDIIIHDVYNLRITGIRTNGSFNSNIKCKSSAGIAIVNSKHVVLESFTMTECSSDFKRVFNGPAFKYFELFQNMGLFVMNSWFVSVVDVHLQQSEEAYECGLQALNILGKSVMDHLETNCLEIHYQQHHDLQVNITNELHIKNYQSDTETKRIDAITVVLSGTYNLNIILEDSNFSDIQPNAFDLFCSDYEGYSLVEIIGCNFRQIFGVYNYELEVASFRYRNCFNELNSQPNKVSFINCNFSNNAFVEEGRLLDFYIDIHSNNSWLVLYNNLRISIINCTFHDNQNLQLISVIYSDTDIGKANVPQVIIKHTKVTYLTTINVSYAIEVYEAELYFFGPVVLQHIVIDAEFIFTHSYVGKMPAVIKATDNFYLNDYVEISECVAETALYADQLYISEYTLANFTSNDFSGLMYSDVSFSTDPASILTPMMLMPCIFQYTSKRGNLDQEFQTGKNLSYAVVFNKNNIEFLSYYKYNIIHCGWDKSAAFLKVSPYLVNQRIIHYINDSLEDVKVLKDICFCDDL